MWHTTYTQGNQGDSRAKSQIGNLTPSPSFGHNLCFKWPNDSCKPTLDIYVPRVFLIIQGIFQSNEFWPLQSPLKIRKSIETTTPKVGAHLGVWGFIPSHFPKLLGTWNVTLGFHFWLAPLQALILVTCLRACLYTKIYLRMMMRWRLTCHNRNIRPLQMEMTHHKK